MVQKIDSFPFRVEPFHVDVKGKLFLSILGNHLLNAAGNHSQSRGWGMTDIHESSHTWVLSRLSIEMTDMPQQGDIGHIDTWVESVIRLFTNRNFAILRPDGTPYGFARSIWAMIDMNTRKPCDLPSLYDGDILRYVVDPSENNCPIQGHGKFRFVNPQHVQRIQTTYHDIDINGHVNSIKYIEHILNLFSREQLTHQEIKRFEIAYKTEAYWGDALDFYLQTNSDKEFDVEVKKNNNETVCQAKIKFK